MTVKSLLVVVNILIIFSLLLLVKNSEQHCSAVKNNNDLNLKCNNIYDLKRRSSGDNDKIKLSLDQINLEELDELDQNSVNYVNILEIFDSINELRRNIFKNFRNITQLKLNNNNIKSVRGSVFNNENVKVLDLEKNQIETIARCAFCNLPKLEEILMQNNEITEIHPEIFSHLPLRKIDLSHNKIKKIHNLAFDGLVNLEYLYLSSNLLSEFKAQDYLNNPETILLWLMLEKNLLTKITAESFKGLKRMNYVNLHVASVEIIETDSFKDCGNLHTLNLGENQIRVLEADTLPSSGIPNLMVLYLDGNRLNYLRTEFLERLPRLRNIKLYGNPWSCPCYDLVRQWLDDHRVGYQCDKPFYQSGKLPHCVVDTRNQCQFRYNLENYEILHKHYENILAPYCVFGASDGIAYDQHWNRIE